MTQLFTKPVPEFKYPMASDRHFTSDKYFYVFGSSGIRSVRKLAQVTMRLKGNTFEFVLYWDDEEHCYTVAEFKSSVTIARVFDTSGGILEVSERAKKLIAEWADHHGPDSIIEQIRNAQSFLVVNDKNELLH